jgi:DEAD/DEAH box helicase domain-containing protein
VYADFAHGDMRITECNINIRETVVGFKERRGNNEFNVAYPLDPSLGLFFDQQYFNRTVFTSGVMLVHQALDVSGVDLASVGEFLLEGFLMEIPFDRQDIAVGMGTIKQEANGFIPGKKFVCLYDKQHSLRLSGELVTANVVRKVLSRAVQMCERAAPIPLLTLETLQALERASQQPQVEHAVAAGIPVDERYVVVLLPGEVGVDVSRDNTDFQVSRVFYHPLTKLSYRGVHIADAHRAVGRPRNGNAETIVSVDQIRPIPGQTRLGWYDLQEGELVEKLPGEF